MRLSIGLVGPCIAIGLATRVVNASQWRGSGYHVPATGSLLARYAQASKNHLEGCADRFPPLKILTSHLKLCPQTKA